MSRQDEGEDLTEIVGSLPLLEYLTLHPHPAFVLPSPRLSSSSSPSLKPLWSNPSSQRSLGESFESCLDDDEQSGLKSLIASQDISRETDDMPLQSPDDDALRSDGDAYSAGSVISFNDEADDFFALTLFSPNTMAKKRVFQALLIPSGHPSFLILQLYPPPKKFVPRSSQDQKHTPTTPRFPHLPPPSLAAANKTSISSRGSKDSHVSARSHSSRSSQGDVILHPGHNNRTSSRNVGSTLSGRTKGTDGSAFSKMTNGSGISGISKDNSFRSILSARNSLQDNTVQELDEMMEGSESGRSQDDEDETTVSCEELLKTTDWSATPLGPREKWPGSLKTAVSILMKTPNEAVIWWGPEYTMIYNNAYSKTIDLIGEHPAQFGQSAAIGWGDVWKEYQAMAEEVKQGASMMKDDDLMFLGDQETYHTWRWAPLSTEDGEYGGLMINSFETTKNVLKQRWLTCLRDLSNRITSTRTIKDYSEGILRALDSNSKDFSFAYLYQAKDIDISDQASSASIYLQLAGTIGVPAGHSSAPQAVNLNHRSFDQKHPPLKPDAAGVLGSPWPFREAFMTQRSVHIESLDPSLVNALEHRSWGEPPQQAVCIPVSENFTNGRLVFLVVGLNTRRPYDADYAAFLNDLKTNLTGHLKSIASFEAETQRITALEAMDRAKTTFFTSISHELKTPLTLIGGPLHDLLEHETNIGRKKQLTLALRNTARLARLIDSLMDFSRIEAGRLRGRFRPVDLSLLTIDLASLFRSAIEKHLKYEVRCEPSAGHKSVYVDRDLYEKIIFNIIGNSFKYTLEGHIAVSVVYHENCVQVAVSDSGVGIPQSELTLVFERFHRVSSSARSIEGTGIGLSLTSELVHLHGATLSLDSKTAAESADGTSGSTFTISFPYGKDHLPPAQTDDTPDTSVGGSGYAKGIVDEADRWRKEGGSSKASASESGNSNSEQSSQRIDINSLLWEKDDQILIVDDSTDMRSYIRSILSPYCRIIEACDGNEALQKARDIVPDLIISDVTMPGMNGYELLSALRVHEATALIPLILLTAQSGDEERVNGLLAGAEDYLAKPFSTKELIARSHLQMILGKKRIELEGKFTEQLRANRFLTEVLPVGICRMDHEGNVIFVNDSWYAQSGHPRDRPVDDWIESIHEDHREVAMAAFSSLFDTGASLEFKWVNGRWSVASAVLLSREQSATTGVLISLTDISDRKRLEDERRLHAEREEAHQRHRAEASEEKSRIAQEQRRHQEFLVSVISHELRNPTSAILQISGLCKGNLAFLRDELVNAMDNNQPFSPNAELINLIEEDLSSLDSIYEMGQAQERIANDVLSLGKMQLQTLEIASVPTDIRSECERLVSTFQNECRMKSISLELEIGEQLRALSDLGLRIFYTDPVRLNQVIINVLANAIRFTANAPVRKIVITLDVRRSKPEDGSCVPGPLDLSPKTLVGEHPYYVFCAVKDSGPGLPSEQLSKLFKRFSQASQVTHTVFGGSGLGLYVCRMITGLMHGAIEVSSAPNQGSTFRFYVEVKTPSELAGQQIVPTYGAHTQTFQKPTRPLHILIVEDNQVNQRVLTRQLKKASLTCEVTNDGQEGLDAIRRSDGPMFDAVLLDISMPVMDGLTATRKIRELEAQGVIPPPPTVIIGLTGNAQEAQISEALEAGMTALICKPYRIENLLSTIYRFTSSTN